MLLVEAGDFSAPGPDSTVSWQTTQFVAKYMDRLGYDAWTPGEGELSVGMDRFLEISATLKAPVVSANIKDRAGRNLFNDHLTRQIGSVRVGITGVTGQFSTVGLLYEGTGGVDFAFRDPIESLKPVVASLQDETDLVVVLAHVGPRDARRIAEEVPGIDVIVAGHNSGYMYNPDRVGNVLIVRSGDRGQYAARLTLTFNSSGEIIDSNGRAEPLNEDLAGDSALVNEITMFEERLAKLPGWRPLEKR